MKKNNLEIQLMELTGKDGKSLFWTARHAVEGVQIFGGIGSGKTSGSGRLLAQRYLSAGFGGLVLVAKPSETQLWKDYCATAGRSDDLIIIEPGCRHRFNFLDYEGLSKAATENIVQVLKVVIRASTENTKSNNSDPFWEDSLDMLMFNVVDLCKLAYGRVSIGEIYNIVQSLPKPETLEIEGKPSAYKIAMQRAENNVLQQILDWEDTFVESKRVTLRLNPAYNEMMLEGVPDARTFGFIKEFVDENYLKLSERTRSIVDFSFSGFLFRLLRDPIFSLFCHHDSTFTPDDCLNGKIILLNLPVKTYYKVGRDSQIMFKFIWQRAMERIPASEERPIVFLWADESQNFLHELDVECQATARECKVATVYISQNLPNYHANMGGQKYDHRVSSLLGNFGTKIFHANSDVETNKYASELIGDSEFEDTSTTRSHSEKFSMSRTKSHTIKRTVRPESFAHLKSGSINNNYVVEGILHFQSVAGSVENFTKVQFKQNSINNN